MHKRSGMIISVAVMSMLATTQCMMENGMPSPSPSASPSPSPSPSPTPTPQPMTVGVIASKDGTLIEDPDGMLANGAGVGMIAGRTGQNSNSTRRAILAFDLAESVPVGSTVTSAVLMLNVSRANEEEQAIALHRVMADWGEGTSSAGSGAGGGQGGGAPATQGDATWIHTFFDTAMWTTPGGDFDAESSATAMVGSDGMYTWGSTETMVSDVQAWVDDSSQSFGWILVGNEDEPGTTKVFDTHESTEELRPILTVTFLPGNDS